MSLTTWTQQLSDALDIEVDFDTNDVLDLARDAAHNVERPAAPLTAFLVGYAAGMRGGGESDVRDCLELASDLANAQEDGE